MNLALNHTYLSQALNLAVQELKLQNYHPFLKKTLHNIMSTLIQQRYEKLEPKKKVRKDPNLITCRQLIRNEFQLDDYHEILKSRCLMYSTENLPSEAGVTPQCFGMIEAYSQCVKENKHSRFNPKPSRVNSNPPKSSKTPKALKAPKTPKASKASKPRMSKAERQERSEFKPMSHLGRKYGKFAE